MNNTFDIKRFGKYLKYELFAAKDRFGLSLLVLALVPVIVFVFSELMSLLFVGELYSYHYVARFFSLYIGCFVITIAAPVKLYGGITDRRAGRDYLLMPASTLEKFASMMIIICLVVPVCYLATFFAADSLMTLFPYYGDFLPSTLSSLNEDIVEIGEFLPNIGGLIYATYVCSALVFTLGAIVFKKSKVALTLLAMFAFDMVLSAILGFVGVAIFNSIDPSMIADKFDAVSPDTVANYINIFGNILVFGTIVLLGGGIFLRLKTIKH